MEKEGEERPSESFEKEKNYINENVSTILDPNSSRTTLNTNENSNNPW